MSEEEQKYFKGLIGFTFDSDDIKYIEKIVDKKDKEIERLKEELRISKMSDKNTYETSQEILAEQQQEIERLNKALDIAVETWNKKQNEIVRLNNIITEYEKWLLETAKKQEFWEQREIYKSCFNKLDKLQELKENTNGNTNDNGNTNNNWNTIADNDRQ